MDELYMQAEELMGERVVELLEDAAKESISIDFNDENESRQLVDSLKEVINILENYDSHVQSAVEDLMAAASDYYVDMAKDGDFGL